MNKQEIFRRSNTLKKPIIIEFWAEWCIPCRIMTPALEKTAEQFTKTVELMRINADEFPQILKEFDVLGIPAMIVVSNGKEISRHTGILDATQLQALFDAVSKQQEIRIPPTVLQRMVRIGSGVGVGLIGFIWGPPIPLYFLGAILAFSGFYDRCPIFNMVYPKIKALFTQKPITTKE